MRFTPVKPSEYPLIPFHAIRALGTISTLVVGIILAVFISNLHQGGFKLPWPFLILLISVVLSLLNYVLTTVTHCFYGLSPRLSLISNAICFLLWLISLGLLCWSMSQTITTTCNATYWATSTGITVCRFYKTLFAFTVLGCIAYLAAIALDVIVRRRQNHPLGEYDPMASNPALNDYKMHDRNSSVVSEGASPYPGLDEMHPAYRSNRQTDDAYRDNPDPGHYSAQPISPSVYSVSSPLEQRHGGEAQVYYQPPPRPRVRFSTNRQDGNSRPSAQTHYDPAAYR
ncbi:hypothetical protein BDV28DRAFT_136660 [Aspergillus coremiiformis]|uniref:MARVEL domain-containing protein n=1 Tax=Aspergillus coremiiformis TaxID=138285 RepID=A0A5N6Z4K5_9EURO|nr:hypothetical protein BDV28DRAFT_136660 [Aspergillus coremiiformis]